jgi:hypothetical protein
LTSVLLLAGLLAVPAAGGAPRLLAPPPGAVLEAGDELLVGWEWRPEGTREWEGFLSLDGGRSYPIRITPHLDASISSFRWTLPLLATNDASIRLRFGDGSAEREFDFPISFSIRPSERARLLSVRACDLGREPFPGEEESVEWVEGSASGEGLHVVAPPSGEGFTPSDSLEALRPELNLLKAASAVADPAFRVARVSLPSAESPAPRGEPAFAAPLLLLMSRLNL